MPKDEPKKDDVSAKEWTLKYAEMYDDDDEEDWMAQEEEKERNAKKDPVSINNLMLLYLFVGLVQAILV